MWDPLVCFKFRPMKTPEWFKVFEKLSEIRCDPLSKASLKEAILDLLSAVLIHQLKAIPLEPLNCLSKYGTSAPSSYRKTQQCEKILDETGKFASELERFIKMDGEQPGSVRFLRTLRKVLWGNFTKSLPELGIVLCRFGSQRHRISAYWSAVSENYFDLYSHIEVDPAPEQEAFLTLRRITRMFCVAQKRRGWKIMRGACPIQNFYNKIDSCHDTIVNNDLVRFVFHARTRRRLSMADFLGIVYKDRLDFLDYLLIDRPDKKLPFSRDDLAVFFASNPQILTISYESNPLFSNEIQLKALQLLEQREPGCLGKIEDPFGRNLLWYTLLSTDSPIGRRIDRLTPAQKFLYGLCDHAKKDCTGISFDDMVGASLN